MLPRVAVRTAWRYAAAGSVRCYQTSPGFMSAAEAMKVLDIDHPITQEKLDEALKRESSREMLRGNEGVYGDGDMSGEYKARVAYSILVQQTTGKRMDQQKLTQKVKSVQSEARESLLQDTMHKASWAILLGVTGGMAWIVLTCYTMNGTGYSSSSMIHNVHMKSGVRVKHESRSADDIDGDQMARAIAALWAQPSAEEAASDAHRAKAA